MQPFARALVLGLGSSGEGSVRLLRSEGTRVTAMDRDASPAMRERAGHLEGEGVSLFLGEDPFPDGDFDVCVVSPAVPASSEWVKEATRREIPVLSELELGWSRCRGPVLAVTGANGKSTVVKWCCEALQRAGRRARIAGNYGLPITEAVLESPEADPWVLEVSSFQLETVRDFRADVGILLNAHANHLDRHGDIDAYHRAKARLFAGTREGDVSIVPQDLLGRMRQMSRGRGRWLTFGSQGRGDFTYWLGQVTGPGLVADIEGTMFANDIMGPSAAGAIAGLSILGVDARTALEALHRMEPLPHRMQTVGEFGGVRYVNDSKATNLAAMAAALKMTSGPVRLIAGGLAKEKDFESVRDVLADRAKAVYLIGNAAGAMESAWAASVPCARCGTLEAAVRRAAGEAGAGETVLLSPGCASFDQFRNFEERGERFASVVKSLAEEALKWETR